MEQFLNLQEKKIDILTRCLEDILIICAAKRDYEIAKIIENTLKEVSQINDNVQAVISEHTEV